MSRFATLSIKSKIVLIIVVVSFIVISITTTIISYVHMSDYKENLLHHSQIKAKLVGEYCITALSFNYPKRAEEILEKLKNDPSIIQADIYHSDLTPFASYPESENNHSYDARYTEAYAEFDGDTLNTYQPIAFNNEVYGYIHLQNFTSMSSKLRDQITMILILFAGVMLFALFIARALQSIISNPIISLSNIAHLISTNHDYSIRVKKVNSDEIGELFDNFNTLLSETEHKEIERNEAIRALQEHKETLETKVKERTDTLMSTQKELIDNAHKAGMADIASGALHNVGNILNSIKTSASLILEFHNNSGFSRFKQANTLLRDNFDTIEDFIIHDPKGKKLLMYYLEIEKMQESSEEQINSHIHRLIDKVNSSVDVIHAQQSYASATSLTEMYSVSEIIEDGLAMESSSIDKHGISIVKNYYPVPDVPIQRTKLIHIIINLINNAKEAMEEIPRTERTLSIEVVDQGSEITITVSDSGHGISPENLNNIFSHGFTTKEQGHGFGLHSCANYMTEMGGRMSVSSGKVLPGATFTLIFVKELDNT
ncbi:MAG: ATP-binding protein [Fibrobacterales bacterium]